MLHVVIGVAALALTLACDAPARDIAMSDSPEPGAPDEVKVGKAAPTWGKARYRVTRADRGLFSKLDSAVRLRLPPWLERAPVQALRVEGHPQAWLYLDGHALGAAPQGWSAEIAIDGLAGHDRDGDGIPDQVDILLGAKKAVANGADYKATYEKLAYPGGDVPLSYGVCTDVVVRALRNAGYDLQELLHDDIARKPKRYPMVKKANTHIDHRRVKTLLPYFKAHWRALSTQAKLYSEDTWLPGDIVFMQTMGDKRPDHLGIVSDTLGPSGLPLIINNWTTGFATSEMDLLWFVPVTHRFRLKAALEVPAAARGLEGLLRRRGLKLPPTSRQVVVVTSSHWRAQRGTLRRFARKDTRWRAVGEPVAVALGGAGMGVGRGLSPLHVRRGTPIKREGDKRTPAGLFALGTSFGRRKRAPYRGRWPYRRVGKLDRFVDDPDSALYNSWQQAPAQGRWASAEAMAVYKLGVVVEHNARPEPVAGAGSAIFLHTGKPGDVTSGCTAMRSKALRRVLGWLKPEREPVLVQVPGQLL